MRLIFTCCLLLCVNLALAGDSGWDVTKARGKTRVVDFTTREGTWMSVDLSPDARWVVFDLVGNIYRAAAAGGGEAQCLTCDSGVAINSQPRYSPDGRRITFISDRRGQDNLWVMNADGTGPEAVFLDAESRIYDPAWSADGSAIVATRFIRHIAAFHDPDMEIWRFPLSGEARLMAKGAKARYRWPSLSPDGKTLYYYTSYPTWNWLGIYTGSFIQALDLGSSRRKFVREHLNEAVDPEKNPYGDDDLSGGFGANVFDVEPAEFAPEASPDGRYLAYVRRQMGQVLTQRGHEYEPRDALVIRELRSGVERVIVDPVSTDLARVDVAYSVKVVPGYAWAKDSKSLVFSQGGKIRRVFLDSSEIKEIPFTARVQRTLSEAPRSRVTLDDRTQEVKFLQWPSGSPNGRQVAFVAAGQLWIADLADGKPSQARKLVDFPAKVIQLTPAWSPDGSRIAFATWSDVEQGHVWTVTPNGAGLHRVTKTPGQYAYPAWLPDSKRLVVAQGPGVSAPDAWTGWDVQGTWQLLALTNDGVRPLATASQETQPHIGEHETVYFYEGVSDGLAIRSVRMNGTSSKEHVVLPVLSRGTAFHPAMSPSGAFVAFEAAQIIYLSPVRPSASGPVSISADPNASVPNRVRVGTKGGMYQRWRDVSTLEFVSGDRYITYNVSTAALSEHTIRVTLPRATSAKGAIGIQNAKIITAEGAEVIEKGSILIQDARIACLGSCDLTKAARVIDAKGQVIMPGLVDVHDHGATRTSSVIPPHQPLQAARLAYGVTTMFDPSVPSASVFPIAEMTESGAILGPRVFTTAEAVIGYDDWNPNGHLEIESYADAEQEVDRRLEWGAISLKNYWLRRREQQQMLIDVARKRGVTVTAEGNSVERNLAAILDGQTGWEHWIPALEVYGDITSFYGQARALNTPTLSICGHPFGAMYFYRGQHDLLHDEKYGRFVPMKDTEARIAGKTLMTEMSTARPAGEIKQARFELKRERYSVPIVAQTARDIVKAGGRIALGAHGEQPGIGAHWELWAMTEAFTPLEAIQIGTLNGAYFHGLESELGSLKVGKLADLIILNSDPLEDIRNTLDIAYVMKSGRLYDGNTLGQLWPDRVEYQPFGKPRK